MKIKCILFLFSISYYVNAQNLIFGLELNPKIILTEDSDFNFSAGLNAYYDISEKWQLSTGIHFQKDKFEIFDDKLIFGNSFDETTGLLDTTKLGLIEATHSAWFIGIPLQTKIKLIGETKHLYASLGGSLWFRSISNIDGVLNENDEAITDLDKNSEMFDKFAWSLFAGIGYEFPFTSKLKGYIEPRLDYSLLRDGNSNADPLSFIQFLTRKHQLGLGITFGIRFY